MGLQGKKVAVIGNNRYEWCTTYLAVTTGGMIIVPLDKALPANELQSLIQRSGAEAIVCEAKYIEAIKNNAEHNLKYIISMEETIEKDIVFYEDVLNQGKKLRENGNREYEAISINPEEMSIILFTSGTTSASKGVMLSQKNICSDVQAIANYVYVFPTDTLLSVLPIHHTFECTITFLFAAYYGATVAFCEGLKYIQKNMQEFKVSIFVGVPLILENIHKKVWKGIDEQGKTKLIKTMVVLTKLLSKIGIDLRRKVFKPILDQFGGRLRVVFVGAAPLDKKIIKGFNDFGVDLVQGYGLTETSPVVSCETDKKKSPGSIGFPLTNLEVKIEEPDEDGVGEIVVKGPTVMLGYYENEEATNKVMKDGWFSTGDYGYLDKKGFLYISGRKSDVIVLKNGKNIYPQELEFLLNKISGVAETMVFARNKTSMDTTLCAKIVYDKEQVQEVYGEKTEEELKEVFWQKVKEVNQTLPDVKHIKEIMITDEPLAKTTTQKVKRYEEIKRS
ncbi:MAG: long-chain fatty acid--CoA ligase [Clostridia bacterium]|nr:long-chain fatty acid--CoA ligase [Clostridia bacterium]